MKRGASWAVLAACGVVAFLAWQNARLGSDTAELSERAACMDDPGCVTSEGVPREARADPIRRRYEWRTNHGPRLVTCTRDLILIGGWNCDAEVGGFGYL